MTEDWNTQHGNSWHASSGNQGNSGGRGDFEQMTHKFGKKNILHHNKLNEIK